MEEFLDMTRETVRTSMVSGFTSTLPEPFPIMLHVICGQDILINIVEDALR